MLFEILALLLGLVHFGVPLTYYTCMKKFTKRPWNIKIDPSYRPAVMVVIPTYNEAAIIEDRLNNMSMQDYCKELTEVVVMDSSNDDTAQIAENWAKEAKDARTKVIRQGRRDGKARALNFALKSATEEILVIADADASWPGNALTEAVRWLSDPTVGAVSCLKKPLSAGPGGMEEGYRRYYNTLRLGESKAFATPIFHGELAAFRRDLLLRVGGFPENLGADDSHTATKIALLGYRAIIPETLWCEEVVPRKSDYFSWRVRRAQHLILHFLESSRAKPKGNFAWIIAVETFLHLINPWILLMSVLLVILAAAIFHSLVAYVLVTIGLVLLSVNQYRMWLAQQSNLLFAALRNITNKEIVWKKQIK